MPDRPKAHQTAGSRKELPQDKQHFSTRLETDGKWTVRRGQPSTRKKNSGARGGTELLTYNNPFAQKLERVWYDGTIYFAMELGEVDVKPDGVKVAQEYQIVYYVKLNSDKKPIGEPEAVPDQMNIYDSIPGMEKYSPIWQFNYVVVPRSYEPNTLRSESDCRNSGFPIVRSNVLEN